MSKRVVYMGTPAFACPALERLASMPGVSVELVVTQPDRASGRGRRVVSPPVKDTAERLGLPIHQTPTLKTEGLRRPIAEVQPDLVVVAAFGVILGTSMLRLPEHGCVNLHASLLPRYRGAAPVSAAILSGDEVTGVSLMQMEAGLDTGPMYASNSIDITNEETTESLTERLSLIAADLLEENLEAILEGRLSPVSQPDWATLTRPLVKADGWIDWNRPADQIERHVRAMWSWPRAWTRLPSGDPFQIHRASVSHNPPNETPPPGKIVRLGYDLGVACGDGVLVVETGQLPGGKPADGRQLANHKAFDGAARIGTGEPPESLGPLIRRIGSESREIH